MKQRAHCIIFMMMASLSCLRQQAIEQTVVPVERPEVEITGSGSALIRSSSCDIIMEPLDPAMWRALLRSGAYTHRKTGRGTGRRIPPLTFIHVIIRNTATAPLIISSARIRYGGTDARSLTARDIGRLLASPAYSIFDFDSLLSFRRLMEERDSAAVINYDLDTVRSLFPFVPPGDTALTVIAFDQIPADVLTWRVSLTVEAGKHEKNISFDFYRHERRTEESRAAKKKPVRKNARDK